MEGLKVSMYGDGSNVREWIYVDDYCRALDTILNKGVIGDVYNIGSGWERSNKDVTHALLNIFEEKEDMIEYVKDRPGHDWRYAVDSSKLRDLGWKPSGTFEDRLRETVEWYKTNEAWWKPLKEADEYIN
jgi:dTDP-glucose 4,6-dehydratase